MSAMFKYHLFSIMFRVEGMHRLPGVFLFHSPAPHHQPCGLLMPLLCEHKAVYLSGFHTQCKCFHCLFFSICAASIQKKFQQSQLYVTQDRLCNKYKKYGALLY